MKPVASMMNISRNIEEPDWNIEYRKYLKHSRNMDILEYNAHIPNIVDNFSRTGPLCVRLGTLYVQFIYWVDSLYSYKDQHFILPAGYTYGYNSYGNDVIAQKSNNCARF